MCIPTFAHENRDMDEVFELISEKIDNMLSKECVILLEDMNAMFGEERKRNNGVVGSHNERGRILMECSTTGVTN